MKTYLYSGLILLLIQPIVSFCIYNNATDNTKIMIRQSIANWPHRVFSGVLNPNENKCCHYTNRDCSFKGEPTSDATFVFNFENDKVGNSGKQTVKCITGGAIAFYGEKNKIIAYCTRHKNDTIKAFEYHQ
ncbi:hypothetical protein K501DRAFT_267471 [Backusella circina FSU 941]|nr:hypothetical protein K501DRAFT_267471 [Backusella circina FSU 941]